MPVSSYLTRVFDERAPLIDQIVSNIDKIDFDTLVGTGLSGALVVPEVALRMNKHWAIVRKENDSEHAEHLIEGTVGELWFFLDDLISSGKTLKFVKEKMGELDTEFVGYYMYHFGVLQVANYEG